MTADPATREQGIRRLRRSPLAHRAAELAACIGSDTLAELPFLSMVNLRVAPGSDAAIRVQEALGTRLPGPGSVESLAIGEVSGRLPRQEDAPPTLDAQAHGPALAGHVRSVLWLGPDEWLVVGPDGDTVNVISLLVEALAGDPGSVVDVSANRTTLVISGPRARDLLEKGCTLDLHPRSFGPGRCAQTTFARGHILLWQAADDQTAYAPAGRAYRILFRSSFADYFADWLLDAATEFARV